MAKILNNKLFVKTLLANLISNFGDVVYYLALMKYVAFLPERRIALSMISFSEAIPQLAAFVTGYFADKTRNKIRSIFITMFMRAFLYFVLAIAMGFSPSLIIVGIAVVINIISDISGLYENGMFFKIEKNIIPDEDREKFIAFEDSTQNILNVVFRAIGGVLIVVLSYQNLAFLNASTFLFSAIILATIKAELIKSINKGADESNNANSKFSIKKIYLEQKKAFNFLFSANEIKLCVVVWPITNAIMSIVMWLIVLMIGSGSPIIIVSAAITIVAVEMSRAFGSFIGGYLSIKYFERVSINTLIKSDVITMLIMFISLYYRQIYLVLVCFIIMSISELASNAKVGSIVMNTYDEDKLATIFGGMFTYFSLGPIISGILFGILVLILSVNILILITTFVCMLLVIYTFLIYKNEGSVINQDK